MHNEMAGLFNERLGRYQAAISLKEVDRIPIAAGSNFFSEVYSGYNKQEIIYDSEKWLQAEKDFIADFPEVDALRNNKIWAPLFDSVDFQTYKLPGRELSPDVQFQFIEKEYMKADEYDVFIAGPAQYLLEKYLPRVLGELADVGSPRSYIAAVKGGIAHMMMLDIMKNRSLILEKEFGMPQPISGVFVAPFDLLADSLRGLQGIMLDMYRQPDKLLEACDVLVEEMVNHALLTADPAKRYPIFVPTHKACFLSPKQFDIFYWPSFKKVLEAVIENGYTVRAYLEGDWSHHWHHMTELPKGTVICDIDNQGDIFQAKKDIGNHQCLAGGIPDSLLALGNPGEVRERVKLLCETVARDGGFIINGGCSIPYETKPENYRAMIDAVIDYGTFDNSIKPSVKQETVSNRDFSQFRMFTPWEVKRYEIGEIMGDEEMIRKPWENLEVMAYLWLWQWAR